MMTPTRHEDMSGCDDCPADVVSMVCTSPVTGGPVLVLTVAHEPTCPFWARHLAGQPALWSIPMAPDRLLRYVLKGEGAEAPGETEFWPSRTDDDEQGGAGST